MSTCTPERRKIGKLSLVFWALLFLPLIAVVLQECPSAFCATAMDPGFVDETELDYYGCWVDVPPYGSVWHPHTAPGWRPFHYGHWVWTNYGWMWISYEPFGWIVYHYGYWYYDKVLGWCWIPGYEWRPANVLWIQLDIYIGWAPLPPPGIIIVDPWDDVRFIYWNFVPQRYFLYENVGHYRIVQKPKEWDGRQTVIKHPPSSMEMERAIRRKVQRINIPQLYGGLYQKQKQYLIPALPKMERQKIDRNRPEVERKVLKRAAPLSVQHKTKD